MNPKCNLPEPMRRDALLQFDGQISAEEEERIRELFPQYLFFRNEYEDDGWNVSQTPIRLCTCTACGESFEAVRGNYARGRLHHEKCNCPQCDRQVEGIAVAKYGYDMKSLGSWIKIAVARPGKDGALLVEAMNVRRRFTWDTLQGEIDCYPVKRYSFSRDGAMEWKLRTVWPECCGPFDTPGTRWVPTKTVGDPFQPNMMGWNDYNGEYSVIGLEAALRESSLRYCQILEFYHRRAYADLDRGSTARGIVKYLAWYCHHPQIEMAVKLGLEGAVEELVTEGRKNARILNWKAERPEKFLCMSRQETKLFLQSEMDFQDLKNWKEYAGGLALKDWLGLIGRIGGTAEARELIGCATAAGVTAERAANYVEKLQPDCARYRVPYITIIRTWKDYLGMAGQLGYDLRDITVAMPKELQQRHDAAAETIYCREHEEELRKYKKRRRQLEKQFAFRLGNLCIRVPTSAEEIVREGQTLHHCVGGYAARHMNGETTILFLRHVKKPGRPFLTIELEKEKGQVRIRQIHGYRNEHYAGAVKPELRFGWFLEAWLGWVNAGSERDRDGNPILPEEETTEITEVKTA